MATAFSLAGGRAHSGGLSSRNGPCVRTGAASRRSRGLSVSPPWPCGSLAGRHLLDGAEPRSHPSPAQRQWDPGVDGPSSGCSGSREHCAGPAPPRQPRRAPAGPSPALLPSCRPGCADSPACSWLHGPHAAAPPAGLAPAFQGGPGEGRREGASWRRRPLSAAGPPCALCRSRSGGRRPGGP